MSRVLRSRLGIVQMLASLTIFNLAHADKCVDFLLSDNDKRQWKVQNIYFRFFLNLLESRGDRLAMNTTDFQRFELLVASSSQIYYLFSISPTSQIEANSELRWPLYETMLEKTPGPLKTKQEMMQVERYFLQAIIENV